VVSQARQTQTCHIVVLLSISEQWNLIPLSQSTQNFSATHHQKMAENGSYMYIKAFKPFNLSTQQLDTRISMISCWGKRTQTTSIKIMKEGTKKGPLTANKKQEKNRRELPTRTRTTINLLLSFPKICSNSKAFLPAQHIHCKSQMG
jgi:hypothetical protein